MEYSSWLVGNLDVQRSMKTHRYGFFSFQVVHDVRYIRVSWDGAVV